MKQQGCTITLGLTVAAICIVIALAGDLSAGYSPNVSAVSASRVRRVVYKVTTNRDSSIYPSCYAFDTTYAVPNGTAQRSVNICNGARTEVVHTFTGSRGDFVYLSVQNDEYLARIACEIYIDDELVYRTFSQGQYVIASCGGSIP